MECLSRLKQFTAIIFFFAVIITSSAANANTNQNIPESLQEWVPWVLKDAPTVQCPILYNQNKHYCAYPSSLNISMSEKEGEFKQVWDIYAESWIVLPGDIKNWPQKVRVNNKAIPVISRNNKPHIQLEKGHYMVSGKFSWEQRPKSLSIPSETGLVNLTIDNTKVALPDFRQGKLWLKTTSASTHQNNRLELQVFRKISDTIPMRVTTQIKLDVSGQQREIIIDGALLSDFSPSAIDSPLPSQMDKNGRLKIQIRPGQWTVDISAFNPRQVESIVLSSFKTPWPGNEVWVVDQQTQLRLIKVVDKNSIDPNQTQLSQRWKSYPAYNMQGGEKLSFKVIKRGDPDPEPDQLSINKRIWLDFDGNGFTINDKLTGTLTEQWRLNASSDVSLGQVTLNGKPQFITTDSNNKQGVEVRHGNLDLSADSRVIGDTRILSSGGWDMDFNQAEATLYLPAGWRLLSLTGANTSNTWINKWSLLDLFMVLITAIAIYKLWGIRWGVLGLVALIILWHEYDAPQYIWINLIIAIAMLRSLPQGRFYKIITSYRLLTSVVLLLITLPFIVNQARTAIYPQLEFSNMSASNSYARDAVYPASTVSPVQKLSSSVAERALMADEEPMLSSVGRGKSGYLYEKKRKQIITIDPDAMIQTGPGLPSWTLHQFHLRWDGPVRHDQTISMTLLSPAMNSLLNILRIALVLLLAWRLLDIGSLKIPKLPVKAASKTLVTIFLVGSLFGLSPTPADAAYPSQEMLNQLYDELTREPECLPQCASIEALDIDLSSEQLTLNMRVHAHENVSLPLPVPVKQWSPSKISVDDKSSAILSRQSDSTLWIYLTEGSHTVKFSGRVTALDLLQLSFPLKPHYIALTMKGWTEEGMDSQAHKITALSFQRIADKTSPSETNKIEQKEIPVYAEVTRELQLGLDWYVTTTVQGVSGSAYPVILEIPLLTGESVVTDNIKVVDGHAIITLSRPDQKIRWTSKLKINDQINLKASEQGRFIEKWSLNSSAIWHIDYDGIPVIYHQRYANQWQPEWQPWPGEEVVIKITRPAGVKGNTITIDSSKLSLTPGEQITASKLAFNLRSSLGGQHTIKIPENTDLQTVMINGQSMPIRRTDEGIALPVSPGNQKVEINWHETRGISPFYKSSEVDLGTQSVNHGLQIEPGYNRWVLFTSGPTMGPAVLFWGVFGVIILIAIGLGRVKDTPLSTLQWLILAIGLSASEPWAVIIIAVCILALKARASLNTVTLSNTKFNFIQIGLVGLMFFSIGTLIVAIQQGLLGSPDMQIIGNGSSANQLNWFSDRISSNTPSALVISVPVFAYRLMMLAWSIWLAFALIKWAQWGWGSFTSQEYWRNVSIKNRSTKKKGESDESKS